MDIKSGGSGGMPPGKFLHLYVAIFRAKFVTDSYSVAS